MNSSEGDLSYRLILASRTLMIHSIYLELHLLNFFSQLRILAHVLVDSFHPNFGYLSPFVFRRMRTIDNGLRRLDVGQRRVPRIRDGQNSHQLTKRLTTGEAGVDTGDSSFVSTFIG